MFSIPTALIKSIAAVNATASPTLAVPASNLKGSFP